MPKHLIPSITSVLSGIIGILVLWGWFTKNDLLVNISPHFMGMQYNSALCFVLASIAMLAVIKNFKIIPCLLSIFVLSVGYLSFAEYFIDLGINLDSLLMPDWLTQQMPISKRMSPNGALTLGIIGTSIFLLGNCKNFKLVNRNALFVLMILNLVAITISFVAIFGYIVDLPGTSGWGSYTKMALHSAVANTFLCIGIISLIYTTASDNNLSFDSWTPWLVFVVLEVITLSFWQAAVAYVEKIELQENAIASESIRSVVKEEIEVRRESLTEMARRWQVRKGGTPYKEWTQDASSIMSDQPGYSFVAWVDPQLFVRWVVPVKGNEAAQNINLMSESIYTQNQIKAVKNGTSIITPLHTLQDGQKGFLIYIPIGKNKNFQGIIMGKINAKQFFDEVFKDVVKGYNVAIFHNNELIYQRHPNQGKPIFHNDITYLIKEHDWIITSWPLPEIDERQHPWLPKVILFVGFIIATMLSLITYLAQIARKNALLAKEEIKVRRRTEQQLIVYSKKLKKQSLIDPLTKVDNRRSLTTILQDELTQHRDRDLPLSIILIDVDHFKQINDTYGHVTGDNVLQRVGSILRKSTRSTDAVARYGGEEFCIVLRNTSDRQAYTVAEKLRLLLSKEQFLSEKKDAFRITCSFGVYQISPKMTKISQIFAVVDGALYAAKNSGRNCVVLV